MYLSNLCDLFEPEFGMKSMDFPYFYTTYIFTALYLGFNEKVQGSAHQVVSTQ